MVNVHALELNNDVLLIFKFASGTSFGNGTSFTSGKVFDACRPTYQSK